MRYTVRLSDQAAEDLGNIVSFIAQDNPQAGEKFGLALVEAAFSLATFPYRGQTDEAAPKGAQITLSKIPRRL